MKSILSLLVIFGCTSNTFAQIKPELADTVHRFTTAWQKRDHQTVKDLLLPDAEFFGANGGDFGTIKSALRGIQRRMKSVTSNETLIDRDYRQVGNAAIVTDVVRVDHKRGKRRYATGLRRSMLWVLQANMDWKLAHMHLSAYSNFASAITEFETEDKEQPTKPGGVVFVGSSSIRMWKTLKQDFPNTNTVHRGFGGSQMVDCIMYVDQLVTRHKPRKVVVYEGDNDVGGGKSAERVLKDFKTLVGLIHDRVPDAEIGFIAIKPSRARWKLWPEMAKANKLVKKLCETSDKLQYLDIATPMLDENGGQPAADWFIADGLHMRPKGYALWTQVIRPWVDQE